MKSYYTKKEQSGEPKMCLGIDWGEKRIGLSMGETSLGVAVPFDVVSSVEDIIKIVNDEDIDILVLGEPKKMGGSDLPLQDKYIKFKNKLTTTIDLPLELVDERLSSKAADALKVDKKNSAARDAVAAMLILQTYLDSFI